MLIQYLVNGEEYSSFSSAIIEAAKIASVTDGVDIIIVEYESTTSLHYTKEEIESAMRVVSAAWGKCGK